MQGDKRRLVTAVLLIACFLMATTWTIKASSGGHYLINWYSMDSGGTMAATGGSVSAGRSVATVEVQPFDRSVTKSVYVPAAPAVGISVP